MPLVATRCEDFSAYVNTLELIWKVEVMMRGPCSSWEQVMYRQRSLGDAPVVMRALSTVKHIMKRSADENVKSSNDIDDESSVVGPNDGQRAFQSIVDGSISRCKLKKANDPHSNSDNHAEQTPRIT